MKRKISILGIACLLVLAGCASRPVERPLPTLAPEVQEQGEAGNEATEEKAETEKSGSFGIMSYVEKSRQAKDEMEADYLRTRLLITCIEAQMEGVTVPKETIRFRYTEDFSEMDDTYGELKEWLMTAEQGSTPINLRVDGNYIMVEISTDEEGMVSVKTELLHE